MLSLIRADGTDHGLPSASSLDFVTRPMAVLVSARETVSRGAVSHCVVHTVCGASCGIVLYGDQNEVLTRGKEEASGEGLGVQ